MVPKVVMSEFQPEMTYLRTIVEFLRTHSGWWCSSCIKTSTGRSSLERITMTMGQLARPGTRYEQAASTDGCEGCGKFRKCVRQV